MITRGVLTATNRRQDRALNASTFNPPQNTLIRKYVWPNLLLFVYFRIAHFARAEVVQQNGAKYSILWKALSCVDSVIWKFEKQRKL